MTKLNQIIAISKDVNGRAESALTKAYHNLQKSDLLTGISRRYDPRDEEGDHLPSESKRPQIQVEDILEDVTGDMAKMFNITFVKDKTNQRATANVVVEGITLLTDVPSSYLLFLEKQLVNIKTFVSKIPILDSADRWHYSEEDGYYVTDVIKTVRTKKVPRNHVKAPATEHHPAQVEVYFEDIVVGDWSTVKFSGALPATRIRAMVARVEKLQSAVKMAREAANSVDVVNDDTVGEIVFDYIFGE